MFDLGGMAASEDMGPTSTSTPLFEVYLRLRPPIISTTPLYPILPSAQERHIVVEDGPEGGQPATSTHITLRPPPDSRKRAIEKFAFTKVFQETAEQLDILEGTGTLELIQGVLGGNGRTIRDGLLATLGATGSGKSHTVLGSKTQRGLTQLSLDVLFRSLGDRVARPSHLGDLMASLSSADVSEAQILPAEVFLDSIFAEGRSSRAQTPLSVMDVAPTPSAFRRHILQRPSVYLQVPDVSSIALDIETDMQYAIIVSMYEVYNDRIFDLLSGQATSAGGHKDLRRRPMLFKSTEKSPDRKVVAGLRKIVCGSLKEALLVLEAGLTERRVAGTGSNSVSSRSHGFFCFEVKQRKRSHGAQWSGATLTIVDLAGSERARNAKTAGATLAEAGKINESLMYLGQCLQMQTDTQDGTKPFMVPFRQCKLTELLFSNSFSTTNYQTQNARHAQRGIMVVTADPLGDFNITSQILRYSALAREVTVPRIPSVASTILSGTTAKSQIYSGRTTPSTASMEELENAAQQIQKLTEEVTLLNLRLDEEAQRRKEIEACWQEAEERCLSIEQEIRETCWLEMEQKIQVERATWKAMWGEEADRNDEHVDKKLEILSKSIQIYEDPELSSTERLEDLEEENAHLRDKIETLERQLQAQSPTKRRTMRGESWSDLENAMSRFGGLSLQEKTPKAGKVAGKKQRVLTTRKWDLAPEESPRDFD